MAGFSANQLRFDIPVGETHIMSHEKHKTNSDTFHEW